MLNGCGNFISFITQIRKSTNAPRECVEAIVGQMSHLRTDTSVSDIVFLCDRNEFGRFVVKDLEEKEIKVEHTFDEDDSRSRTQKLYFFKGAAKIKATTPYSFKGWETRHLVVYIEKSKAPKDLSLIYTAMTRLQRSVKGSALTVVSSCPELREYGRQWPDFREQ